MIHVVLADDHTIVRTGLKEILSDTGDMEVVGEATNGHEVMARVRELEVDVLVLDMSMPGRSGLEFIKDVHALQPELPILVLSMHDEMLYAERLIRAGARGYIMKRERPEKLVEAIRHVLGGKTYVSEKMAARILDAFSGQRSLKGGLPLERLTDREFEISHLIWLGNSSREIARELHLSVKTVEAHKANAMRKLGLTGRIDIVKYAILQGWLERG